MKFLFLSIACVYLMIGSSIAAAVQESQIPVPGLVTMVDLGAKKCVPCKMMAPILDELKTEYADRAAIVFIDVWMNPDAGRRFGIRAIPTQIFFDAEGKEVGRHEGFLDKASIVAELQKLGVQ
jgi:thioredoxin 1